MEKVKLDKNDVSNEEILKLLEENKKELKSINYNMDYCKTDLYCKLDDLLSSYRHYSYNIKGLCTIILIINIMILVISIYG